MITISLDPLVNKTGDIWHICVEDLPRHDILYGYRVDGPHDWHQGHRFDIKNILIDPYAKLIEGCRVFGDTNNKMSTFFGTYDFDSLPFELAYLRVLSLPLVVLPVGCLLGATVLVLDKLQPLCHLITLNLP